VLAVSEFTCTIGESTLKYRGWGTDYDHAQLLEHRNGFTVSYEAGGELVGRLTCATTSPGA
jgi:3-phenylpropionate/trans-cinnamate dioxygenase ferredoxin reductase component